MLVDVSPRRLIVVGIDMPPSRLIVVGIDMSSFRLIIVNIDVYPCRLVVVNIPVGRLVAGISMHIQVYPRVCVKFPSPAISM